MSKGNQGGRQLHRDRAVARVTTGRHRAWKHGAAGRRAGPVATGAAEAAANADPAPIEAAIAIATSVNNIFDTIVRPSLYASADFFRTIELN